MAHGPAPDHRSCEWTCAQTQTVEYALWVFCLFILPSGSPYLMHRTINLVTRAMDTVEIDIHHEALQLFPACIMTNPPSCIIIPASHFQSDDWTADKPARGKSRQIYSPAAFFMVQKSGARNGINCVNVNPLWTIAFIFGRMLSGGILWRSRTCTKGSLECVDSLTWATPASWTQLSRFVIIFYIVHLYFILNKVIIRAWTGRTEFFRIRNFDSSRWIISSGWSIHCHSDWLLLFGSSLMLSMDA